VTTSTPWPAVLLEFGEQRKLFVGAQAVAGRVGNHGHAAGLRDPAHGIAQAGPAVRHKAGLALDQVFAEHLVGVLAGACLHQESAQSACAR
jgi:hypothetical protein